VAESKVLFEKYIFTGMDFAIRARCNVGQKRVTRKKMILLRQQHYEQQIMFLFLQPKILLQQPNVL